MIAHEHIQRVTRKDVVVVLLFSLITAGLLALGDLFVPLSLSFLAAVTVLMFMSTLMMVLIRKTGMILLFFGLVGVITLRLDDIGVLGYKKILCFIIAALLFELVYLFLKFHVHFVSFDLVVGALLSALSIPLTSALLITADFTLHYPVAVFNLMMLSFVAGFFGSLLACYVWHHVKDRLLFIELDMYLKAM